MNAIIAFSLRFRALMVALYAFVMIGGVTAGRVARRLAAALCARGEPPRALVRNATKARDVLVDNRGAPLPLELVVSELDDRDGVRRALSGIEIAFSARQQPAAGGA
jgi:nucleoside-diphosphate-sugar epimerase